MKRMRSLSTALLATTAAATALAADFTGPADPALFTVESVGTLSGASPSIGFATFGSNQLVLVGGNTANPAGGTPGCDGGVWQVLASPCQLQVTLNTPGTYTFDWSYVTADPDGAGGDLFGVIVDGNRIALSDIGGAIAQTGSASFVASSSFGWLMNCTDCTGGFATATISGFELAPIPEPGSLALLLAGLVTVGALKQRRR